MAFEASFVPGRLRSKFCVRGVKVNLNWLWTIRRKSQKSGLVEATTYVGTLMPACSAVSQNRLFIKLTVFSLLNVRGKLFMQSIRVRSIFVLTNINGIPEIYFYTTYVTLDMQHVFMGHRIQVRGFVYYKRSKPSHLNWNRLIYWEKFRPYVSVQLCWEPANFGKRLNKDRPRRFLQSTVRDTYSDPIMRLVCVQNLMLLELPQDGINFF